jgi:hypothetical protein
VKGKGIKGALGNGAKLHSNLYVLKSSSLYFIFVVFIFLSFDMLERKFESTIFRFQW